MNKTPSKTPDVGVSSGALFGVFDTIMWNLDAAEEEILRAHADNEGYPHGQEMYHLVLMAKGCIRKSITLSKRP